MLEMFEMEFMQRAWIAGIIVAIVCPLIGSFLVLRKQSLIGDGLGHIAFAGVAGGALMGYQPVLSAAFATVIGALGIEFVRKKMAEYSDMVLAIFFYSGMGLAVIFTSMNKIGSMNLSSFLFGSLMTITTMDLWFVAILAIFISAFVMIFYHPLQYLVFDELSAEVAGLPTAKLSIWLSILTALTVAIAMRIVGLLLVAAMMVIPVACAIQVSKSFKGTIVAAVIYALISVIAGLTLSYYANLAPGGTIVLCGSILFVISYFIGNFLHKGKNKGKVVGI